MGFLAIQTAVPGDGSILECESVATCNDLISQIESYRSNTNNKMDHLALAHRSIRNAVVPSFQNLRWIAASLITAHQNLMRLLFSEIKTR